MSRDDPRDRQGREAGDPSDAEIARMMALPAEDPVRRRWEENPRHRAIALGYQAFLVGDDTDATRLPEAEAALRDSLAAEISSTASGSPPLRVPAYTRWAMAAVVVLAVGVGAWMLRPIDQVEPGPTGVLRGANDVPDARTRLTAEWGDSGDLRLEWSKDPRADAYRVSFYDANLDPVLTREVEGTEVLLDADDLEGLAVTPRLWSVQALLDGRSLADVDIQPFPAAPH